MSQQNPEHEDDPFISLGELLVRPGIVFPETVSPSLIATVIEKQGIQGWDRYGRFRTFEAPDRGPVCGDVQAALDAVALQAEHEWNTFFGLREQLAPADIASNCGSAFDRYGWRQEKLPKFAEIEAEQPPASRPSPQRKKLDNATAALLGALKLLLVEDKNREHFTLNEPPPYRSQEKLIKVLEDIGKDNNLPGLGKNTVGDKFKEANQLLNEKRQ